MSNNKKILWITGAVSVAILILLCFGLPRLQGWLLIVRHPDFTRRFTAWIDSIGPVGVPALLFFQVLQIVVAVLPGGLVELAGGMLYGPVLGFVIALSGILLGTLCAFWVSRRFGEPLVRKLVDGAKFDRYARLCKNQKFEATALLFFFLPGVPKDVLIYVVGCSGVLSRRFVLYATLARIPSVAVSCFAGSVFGDGNFAFFAVIYLSFLAVGGVGALVHRRIMRRLERHEK